ncbi:MAG: hypothetical protein ISR65_02980 [Bacteriovoracaceae bacterium]|nr:hypothetical protein [Bacteriovoracaceae bacterium]
MHTRGTAAYSYLPESILQYTYNNSGRVTSLTSGTDVTTYNYSDEITLTSITNPKGEIFEFDFDNLNRLSSIKRPGSETAVSFDDNNFLAAIVHSTRGATPQEITKFNYTTNLIGNKTKITTPSGNYNFSYDKNNQIIFATNPEVQGEFSSEIFTYDSIGNRAANQNGNYSYDNTKQKLIEDYQYYYSYNNNGNMVKKQTKNLGSTQKVEDYYYNSENQLIKIKFYTGTTLVKEVHYLYGANAKRIEKKLLHYTDPDQSFTRRYVYSNNEIIYELDENNTILASFTHSGLRTDDVLSVNVTTDGVTKNIAQTAGSYYYLKDAQGTITDIVNNTGQKLQHYIYSAFGKLLKIIDKDGIDVTTAPPIRQRYTYTGREYDTESGLYFYRARYYDPNIGRFLQEDPDPGRLLNPLTVINRYVYTGNNPINFVDPTGKSFKKVLLGIAAAAAAVFTGGLAGAWIGSIIGKWVASSVLGAILGTLGGAITGALVGGVTGGLVHAALGGSFTEGFKIGAVSGMIAGGIAGGFAGYDAGSAVSRGLASAENYSSFHKSYDVGYIECMTIYSLVGIAGGSASYAAINAIGQYGLAVGGPVYAMAVLGLGAVAASVFGLSSCNATQ